ncbi:transposase [Thiorhodococcus mannitoliphagus]|uniref:Transposase n=1 Tax=Thiorhodococcus mannitoliphagus TaxID=329406 RepID=A0A6P1E079_9GAMM|nr:transposase [Thiorhodococcus mannitoliphagus]NEX22436.1 transposase [Thiorhodococcus mannitoliphagus]
MDDYHASPSPNPHSQDLRKGRFSEPGRAYHITTTTWRRQRIFGALQPARTLIQSLMLSDRLQRSQTLAFVVMPDHLHWLFVLRDGALKDVVGAAKSVAAHRIGGRIWQPGYHDHALRQEEDLRTIARYIVANPKRAGLVERIGDYPHWDAAWL